MAVFSNPVSANAAAVCTKQPGSYLLLGLKLHRLLNVLLGLELLRRGGLGSGFLCHFKGWVGLQAKGFALKAAE